MKKFIFFIAVFIVSLCLCGCHYYSDPVIASLPMYESREFYTSGGFQDSTDYAKYTYRSVSAQRISSSGYFNEVTEDDIEEILSHIENFEGWVETVGDEVEENYDFDKSTVSVGDYFCIDSEYDPSVDSYIWKYSDYTVYYFDTEGQILYYFRTNT